jgi:hypothetical protein
MLSSCLEVPEEMSTSRRDTRPLIALAMGVLLVLAGCLRPDDVPSGPEPVPFPTTTTVRVEYTQPNGCVSRSVPCGDLVIFLGSWMQPGGQIFLTPDASHHVWTGSIAGVPVNFPPSGAPFEVRIYDPFLQSDSATRYTGRRLKVGTQDLTRIQEPGAHDEHALVFVDVTGQGHNPF